MFKSTIWLNQLKFSKFNKKFDVLNQKFGLLSQKQLRKCWKVLNLKKLTGKVKKKAEKSPN